MHFDRHDFLEPIEDAALRIQSLFDKYQHEKFAQKPPEFFSLELCGEAGELANCEKKAWKGKNIAKERFADEAADVFIALMNYVNSREINIGAAVTKKLEIIEAKRLELAQKGESY